MLDDIDNLLDDAINAHEAKDFNAAAIKYTKILEQDAHHADANHNFGLLTIELGFKDEALIFLQTAINTNPNVLQYWVTCLDTLINIERFYDAQSVLEKAHLFGYTDEVFEHLRHNLDLKQQQCGTLVKLTQAGDVKTDFDQATLEICEDGDGDASSVQSDGGVISNDKVSQQEEPPIEQIQSLMDMLSQQRFTQVYEQAQELTKQYSNNLTLWNIMGSAAAQNGQLDQAAFAFDKAITIEPSSADAHNNLGNVLRGLGKLEEALEAFNKSISINPEYAEAFNNIGIVLQRQGKLEEALRAFDKSISIKPDYAEAFNNMGIVLQRQGKLEEAIEACNKAIAIKPDYADAYWNLSGTAGSIGEAKNWIEKYLKADPNHLKAKLALSALKFYEGDKSDFNELMNSALKDHEFMRSFAWAFNLPKLPPLHFHRWALFDHMISLSKKARPFYEFGVWRGEAFKYLIKTFKKGYGFDKFEGIPEDWHNEKAGTYSSDGNIPKIKGGKFIVGKFEDTLPGFFAKSRPMASIINFDADLYSSTICALNFAKPVIDQHTILIFDEFIINKNWEQDEYKALEEFCKNNDCTYEVLAISFFTKQVAVKIVGI